MAISRINQSPDKTAVDNSKLKVFADWVGVAQNLASIYTSLSGVKSDAPKDLKVPQTTSPNLGSYEYRLSGNK